MLLKYIVDRVGDRELIALEKERQALLGKGKEVRKQLKVAREKVSPTLARSAARQARSEVLGGSESPRGA